MGDYFYRIRLNQPDYFLRELVNLTEYGIKQNVRHKVFLFIGNEIGFQSKPYFEFGNYKAAFLQKLKMNNLVNKTLTNDFFNTVEEGIKEIDSN